MKRYSRPLGLVPTVLLGLACSVAVTLFALWAHPVSVLAMLGKMLHQPLILLLNWLPVALLTGAFAFAFRNAFWGAAARPGWRCRSRGRALRTCRSLCRPP